MDVQSVLLPFDPEWRMYGAPKSDPPPVILSTDALEDRRRKRGGSKIDFRELDHDLQK